MELFHFLGLVKILVRRQQLSDVYMVMEPIWKCKTRVWMHGGKGLKLEKGGSSRRKKGLLLGDNHSRKKNEKI
jgi:hypothetical protein